MNFNVKLSFVLENFIFSSTFYWKTLRVIIIVCCKKSFINPFHVTGLFACPLESSEDLYPLDTGHKLNVHKTFRTRLARLLNVFCTFNLGPVSRGNVLMLSSDVERDHWHCKSNDWCLYEMQLWAEMS